MVSVIRRLLILIFSYLVRSEQLTQDKVNLKGEISSILGALGYSPSCLGLSLAACGEDASNISWMDNFKNNITEIKAELQEFKASTYHVRSCSDLKEKGEITSGVRTVYPYTYPNRPVSVFCDQTTDEGGWTVIQRRDAHQEREDFYRTWIEYVLGFGNLTGEFWLGLDNIHALVNTNLMELRVDLEDFEGEKRWAKYEFFHVGDSESKYVLKIGRYSGNAGDSFTKMHHQQKFSTHDQDNGVSKENCAKKYRGAWWYGACHTSNLNGFQYEGKHSTYADGINWYPWHDSYYSLMKTTMSIRYKFR